MKSLLIKDTTVSERAEIVRSALGCGGADCEGVDMEDMYDDYIYGTRNLLTSTVNSANVMRVKWRLTV